MMYQITKQPMFFVSLESRLRATRILWAVSMLTTVLYALLSVGLLRLQYGLNASDDNSSLLSTLTALSLVSVSVSFVLRQRFYRRAVERGEPGRLQKGFVYAFLLCWFPVVLGLFGQAVTLSMETYILYALGVLGQALHFPRRDQMVATYWRGF